MKIAYIGHVHFANRLSSAFQKRGYETKVFDYNKWGRNFNSSMNAVKKFDVIHFISGTGLRKFLYAAVLRFFLNKFLIVHFVGSDVTRLQTRKLFDRLNWMGAINIAHRVFCVASWLTEELKPFCKAETFPLFYRNFSVQPLSAPTRFTILSYIPNTRPKFYGRNITEKLIKNNPDIYFIILGSDLLNDYPNVETHDIDYQEDMNKYYQNISLLLRLTEHDGLSNMVLESLAWNKHVVWTYKFPFVHKVNRNLNDVQQIINELKNNNSNSGASNWIKENFNYDSFLNSLEGLYNNPTSPIKKASY